MLHIQNRILSNIILVDIPTNSFLSCSSIERANIYKRTRRKRKGLGLSEWETQMFNKIDGTNVIINQNTNLIIITEISISVVCVVCTYTNRKHAVTAKEFKWLIEMAKGGRSTAMERNYMKWTENRLCLQRWSERVRARNRPAKCVCFFRVPNNEQWNAENIEQMRKCLVFI